MASILSSDMPSPEQTHTLHHIIYISSVRSYRSSFWELTSLVVLMCQEYLAVARSQLNGRLVPVVKLDFQIAAKVQQVLMVVARIA